MLLGIDAGDLLVERRGKARYLQSILTALSTKARVHATFTVPG